MTKQKAKEQIVKISKMDKQELIRFVQNLYLNKQEIKDKIFNVLVKATDLQMMSLQELSVSPMAVYAEIEMDGE